MSLYLTTYDQLKNSISNSQFANLFLTSGGSRRSEDNMIVHALAGASAEIVSGLFWTPMEVIKNKLQISGNLTSLGIVESRREKINARNLAIDIYKKEGLHGFFRGYWLGLAVFIPYTVVYFTTYEQLKFQSQRYINKRSKLNYQIPLPFYVYVSCSACSGMVAGAISNAFDVVKTRRQTSLSIEKKTKTIVAEIWNQSGWKGFTKGLTARVLWVIPSVTISITVYETLKDSFWV
ncbi:hypothetical protein HK096_010883 [Nowakowskiella sp. JEL0078]|nr:hypothetical protein HK096_010883 [Nowakowskiella sp. JEL0078]